jgi:hypothetical protein
MRVKSAASVRSVAALPFGAFRFFGTARLKDWFRSSAHVLFGDAAWAVFPLARLVLQGVTTGRTPAGQCNQHPTTLSMKALPVLDPKAAAIDVGSERLHVSIGGDAPKVFGTFTGDLEALRDWLKQQGVHSVAMEATGVYWLYLYEAGFAVLVEHRPRVAVASQRATLG